MRRSAFVHLLDLAGASTLAIHAVTQMRVTVTSDVVRLIRWFDQPVELETALSELAEALGSDPATVRACALMLLERGILSDLTAEQEHQATTRVMTGVHGRDPTAELDRYRRSHMEGAHPYWAVEAPHALAGATGLRRRLDVLLLGDCDVQMEADFLRREAARRGVDLRAAASFASDIELARERRHDAIIIGALQARHAIVLGDPEHHNGDPARVYVEAVETLLKKLRAITAAPILIDGLPEPTVQPLGYADRGIHSHRNRFRRTNLALAQCAETFPDVHLVDVAAALGAAGSATLLDDGLVSFTHFGSAGWMLQRPANELAAVHHQFPDMQPLADHVGGDPYRREAVMARVHMDTLSIALALERKKCVIVDLDGVLWPGVLAETGSPFAWTPEIGGPNSYVGLYFGIHEALRMLRRRGILLACVSKNDEATVRALWQYQQHDPRHRLLRPNHFVSSRINWRDKAENIRSIAEELGFPLDDFLFVDDSARERERIRQTLPDVAVLGEDLFALRRILLTDPRLQPSRLTEEAAQRSELVKAQLDRSKLRASLVDESSFVASLAVVSTVEQLAVETATPVVLDRIRELIARTTQFNATGRAFALAELRRLIDSGEGKVFILRMRDRLADHGLVGAAVVVAGEILNFVLSCRVIGLDGERALLAAIIDSARGQVPELLGRILATDRNIPVRHLYADNGFTDCGQGCWAMALSLPELTDSIETMFKIADRLVPDMAPAVP
ncbi:HAD-IIIC family phosphatase [Rhodopila sp.]|uniref:HAD-IIIC family phosphatase n=1 Tax=Rhodopila sp. TaxID=2480087 RepID=UPI003D0B50E2